MKTHVFTGQLGDSFLMITAHMHITAAHMHDATKTARRRDVETLL